MSWLNRVVGSDSPKYERPVKTLVGLAMQRTGRFEHRRIQRDGYTLPFFAASNVALTYWVVPDLVDPTETFVRSALRPDDVFVDVGANVGTVTALAAWLVGPAGRVLAIEPHPATFGLLARTIEANDLHNVEIEEAACGDVPGTATLSNARRKDDNNHIGNADTETDTDVTVRSTTLAILFDEHGLARVDLVKIDVEGFEAAVLRGLGAGISRVDAFYIEVIEANLQRYGDSRQTVVDLLQSNGFACFAIEDDPTNLVAVSSAARMAALGAHGASFTEVPGNPPLG